MKDFIKAEKLPLRIIFGVFFIAFYLGYGHFGDIIIDCGREAHIPLAISNGEILYRDIFCIYGPLPYIFNALFFKIFGANLSILYTIGCVFAIFYTLGVYVCSREFLSKTISTTLVLLVLFTSVFSTTIFNFIFPYSYAMEFAATFGIWILFCLIRYIKTRNINYAHISAFLCGGILVSKIDLIPVLALVIAVFLIFEKGDKDKILKFFGYLFMLPALTCLILFVQGVRIDDYLKNAFYIKTMLNSEALKTFYSNYSIMSFNSKRFGADFISMAANIFIGFIFFITSLWALRKKNIIIKFGLFALMCMFCLSVFLFQEAPKVLLFALLPYVCTLILAIKLIKFIKHRNFKNSKSLSVLALFVFALLSSIKNFHSLQLGFYGTFSFAPLLICLVLFINEILENNALYNTKRQYERVLTVFLSILTFVYMNLYFITLDNKDITIKSNFGIQKASKGVGTSFREAVEYINSHAQKDDTLLVMPEGIMLNFMTGKKWIFYQTSFTPLDFDTFGAHNIIEEIKNKKPQLIAFTSRNTREYGEGDICSSYGAKVCKYVVENYQPEAVFGEKHKIYLFKYSKDNSGKR